MDRFIEKTTHTKEIYAGKIINVQVDDVILPDGREARREIVKHSGGVGIIPITKSGHIICVKQYRKPLERPLIEIPAGKIEKGEKPELTVIRELEEETGYTSNNIELLTSFYTSPGFADELLYIYMTKDLAPVKKAVLGDDDENIEIIELTLEEANECVKNGQIKDAKTNYAILYLNMLEMKR